MIFSKKGTCKHYLCKFLLILASQLIFEKMSHLTMATLHLGTSDYPPIFTTTSNLGSSNYPPTFTTSFNFAPGHFPLPPTLSPSPPLSMLHLGTFDYASTFTTTCDFTPGLVQLLPIGLMTSHFTPGHLWLPTHLSPPPISHLSTFNYPPTFPNTSNFTHGHLLLPAQFHHQSQFHTWGHLITHPIAPPLSISHLGTPITTPLSPPLPISQLGTIDYLSLPWSLPISCLGTSHYPPNFTTTPKLPPGHIW